MSDVLQRIDGLRHHLAETGIDFALIVENIDRFYFTGTMQKGVVVSAIDIVHL